MSWDSWIPCENDLTINIVNWRALIAGAVARLDARDADQVLLNRVVDADLSGISHAGNFTWNNIHFKIYEENNIDARGSDLDYFVYWRASYSWFSTRRLLFKNCMS